MKTAKEMFEELGFKRIRNTKTYIAYKYDNLGITTWLTFDLKAKTYQGQVNNYHYPFSILQHQAITQQMKELGWIE